MASSAPPPARGESTTVFACDFEESSDINYDRWPDNWIRQSGPGYPRYLEVEIQPEQPTSSNHALAIHLDGGAAALACPPIAVSTHYSYVASCRIRTEALKGHGATLRLTAQDSAGNVVEQLETAPLRNASEWTTVVLGPWTADGDRVTRLVLSLHLEPHGSSDLFGTAWFDDVELARVPNVELTANAPFHLFTDPAAPRITCRVSGVQNAEVPVQLSVFDARDQCLATYEQILHTPRATNRPRTQAPADQRQLVWQPPLPGFGYYRITARVQITAETTLERSLSLIAFPPADPATRGEFGWSFPTGSSRLSTRELAPLAEFAGLGWVKVPVWFAAADKSRADDLAWLAERLSRQKIELVGVLDRPPASQIGPLYGDISELPAALAFADPQVWQPLLDPVLTRLSLKTRWWQLGADEDTSYEGLEDVNERLRSVQDYFHRFSQDSQLGIAWPWMHEDPALPPELCSFLARGSQPELTAAELTNHLEAAPTSAASQHWVLLSPLPADQYDIATRVRDLALRMMAAKQGQAATVIVPNPFDPRHGLVHEDGTPRELLLPWTILARHLSGTTYVGNLTLPAGSQAQVFARGDEALLVAWNELAVVEKLYLGDPRRVRALDLWGHAQPITSEQQDGSVVQAVPLDRTPTLVLGASLPIAKLRIDFGFATEEIASVFGREQNVSLQFTNHFPEGVGGTLRIRGPESWSIVPQQLTIRAASGERQEHQFQVRLGTNATCGQQVVRFDFDLRAHEHYQFSVHRPLKVGLGDVSFELHTHVDERGTLFIEQQLVNLSDRDVDFNCLLFLPDQTRQRSQLLRTARGRHTTTYVLPDAASLIGQSVWLRAEEIAGQGRVLNYQAPIEK